MPKYEFRCNKCKQVFHVDATVQEKQNGLKLQCPHCGNTEATQVFYGVSFAPSGRVSGKVQRQGGSGCGCGRTGCC